MNTAPPMTKSTIKSTILKQKQGRPAKNTGKCTKKVATENFYNIFRRFLVVKKNEE